MKYAKKMVMVPDVEYQTLLGLLKSSASVDPLQNEKLITEGKMESVLKDRKLNADTKGRKYDFLVKKRRKLKNMIENRPLKVEISGGNKSRENFSSTSGVEPTTSLPKTNSDDSKKSTVETSKDTEKTDKELKNLDEKETPFIDKSIEASKNTALINQKYYDWLLNYVNENREKFGITKDGLITNYSGGIIKEVDFVQHLKYITGQENEQSKGLTFFLNRLKKDQAVADLLARTQQQQGTGNRRRKKVLVQIKNQKTPGLVRRENRLASTQKHFRPTLWGVANN